MTEVTLTEKQWLTGRDPGRMLDYLRPDDRGRKARLFKCACCYLMWPLLTEEASRNGVLVAERAADGAATPVELKRAIADATAATARVERRRRSPKVPVDLLWARKGAAELALDATTNNGFWASGFARRIRHPAEGGVKPDPTFPPSPMPVRAPGKSRTHLYRWLAHVARDIFGNPFRPVAFSADWRTDTSVALARQMYESRDFSAMPILADALQDAGCDSDDILAHCRGPGGGSGEPARGSTVQATHVRGCWVCDLVLGRE